MRRLWQSLFSSSPPLKPAFVTQVAAVQKLRATLAQLPECELEAARHATDLTSTIAFTAVLAARLTGLEMFPSQVRCALALAHGRIAELPTGEGKTLAAVPALAWRAREKQGVHVMTANDYLARRDAQWMRPVYQRLGLSVGVIQQGMTAGERRHAYAQDVTYAAATEIGFDFLRGQIALAPGEQVQRPFHAAILDEADSILIDEARIPLVIAAGSQDGSLLAHGVNQLASGLRPGLHYFTDEGRRHANLTDYGVKAAELAFGCGNLYEPHNLALYTALQDALHAHVLLRRDVDYLVKDNAIQSIDEYKGRIALDRRWPAGLHTAIEVKEGVQPRPQGAVLGSITIENLVALYPHLAGMTGTAATQGEELQEIYGLEVEAIPPHRPLIRVDHPDRVFASQHEKLTAAVESIRGYHAGGRPVLIGTASIEESEHLSRMLGATPHAVLNARDDEAEAAIIARAGERGAITVSTNMAGRGVDIRLGEGVAGLGGLVVIGVNKHESRRIDNQLRGRAGRQGDPGESLFLVSLQDDLMTKNAGLDPGLPHDPASMQRLVEGQHLDIRLMLSRYESVIEGQRQRVQTRRQAVLTGAEPGLSERHRLLWLREIDDSWSSYLAAVADLRSGVQWLSLGGRPPLHEYLQSVDGWFRELEENLDENLAQRLEANDPSDENPHERGAVWTYLTTDQPFGTLSERIMKGLARKARTRSLWG